MFDNDGNTTAVLLKPNAGPNRTCLKSNETISSANGDDRETHLKILSGEFIQRSASGPMKSRSNSIICLFIA